MWWKHNGYIKTNLWSSESGPLNEMKLCQNISEKFSIPFLHKLHNTLCNNTSTETIWFGMQKVRLLKWARIITYSSEWHHTSHTHTQTHRSTDLVRLNAWLFEMIVGVLTSATSFSRCNPLWFLSMGLRQGSGLCSSSSRKYPGTDGTNQNRHWNNHRWHATNSLEWTRLSCWCL